MRAALLIHEVGPDRWPAIGQAAGTQFHFTLWSNLDQVWKMLADLGHGMAAATIVLLGTVVFFLGAVAWVAVRLSRRDPSKYFALALTHLLLCASLLAFGVLLETRIYLELVPFVAVGTAVLLGDAPSPRAVTSPSAP